MPTTPTLCLISIGLTLAGQAKPPPMDDRVVPAGVRKSTSPSGKYRVEVYNADGWKTFKSRMRFFEGGKLAWDKSLPHAIGPRYFVLSDSGTICFVDEYANIKSERAISAYDRRGSLRFSYSLGQVSQILGVTDGQMIDHASQGWWVTAPPALLGEVVRVPTAGVVLIVDLKTKRLMRTNLS